jgi:Protein of unknown function (DUF3738)
MDGRQLGSNPRSQISIGEKSPTHDILTTTDKPTRLAALLISFTPRLSCRGVSQVNTIRQPSRLAVLGHEPAVIKSAGSAGHLDRKAPEMPSPFLSDESGRSTGWACRRSRRTRYRYRPSLTMNSAIRTRGACLIISGGSAWIGTKQFDVDATPDVPDGDVVDQVRNRQRLQGLLADRFQLDLRSEMRMMSTYALVIAKSGPKLKKSQTPDAPTQFHANAGEVFLTNASLDQFANAVSDWVRQPVLNQTGLDGKYDLRLE